MAIFFQCDCGQDLRADECREGARVDCPACGRSVPVPSLAWANFRLGIGPMPRLEIPDRPAPRPAPPTPPPAQHGAPLRLTPLRTDDLGPELDAEAERRRVRRLLARARRDIERPPGRLPVWRRETHWSECLLYPLRAWPILLILALGWSTLSSLFVLTAEELDLDLVESWVVLAIPLLLLYLLLGYTVAFFRCVLASADAGEAGLIRWPGTDLLAVLWGCAAGPLCFLAGPVVPAAVALLFWLNSGDLAWVDRLILTELGLVAVATWALALLTVNATGRLRDAHPAAWVRHAWGLGWRGALVVLPAAAGVVAAFHLTLGAFEDLHNGPLGWMALCWWGFCGPAWVVFLLRWFGLSRFRAREQRPKEAGRGLVEGPGPSSPGSNRVPPGYRLLD